LSIHIRSICAEDELERGATVAKNAPVQTEGELDIASTCSILELVEQESTFSLFNPFKIYLD